MARVGKSADVRADLARRIAARAAKRALVSESYLDMPPPRVIKRIPRNELLASKRLLNGILHRNTKSNALMRFHWLDNRRKAGAKIRDFVKRRGKNFLKRKRAYSDDEYNFYMNHPMHQPDFGGMTDVDAGKVIGRALRRGHYKKTFKKIRDRRNYSYRPIY